MFAARSLPGALYADRGGRWFRTPGAGGKTGASARVIGSRTVGMPAVKV